MIIRIGNAFIDADFRFCAVPNIGYSEEEKYLMVLQNGVKVTVAASPKMVESAMRAIGYDETIEPDLAEILSNEEWNEIFGFLQEGWRWLAKDRRGFMYIFCNEPQLVGAYWEDPDEGPHERLHEPYVFMEEGEKRYIGELMTPVGGEEDEIDG